MKPASKEPRQGRRDGGKEAAKSKSQREREYDKTLADSFPASDPPAAPSIIGPGCRPESSSDRPPDAEHH